MARIWFKKEMAQLIIEGKKTATTRYSLKTTKFLDAVKGSRFKPVVFGQIKINGIIPLTWYQAIRAFYKQEGFESPTAMLKYIQKEKLIRKDLFDNVFTYEFEFYDNIGGKNGTTAHE